MQRGVTRLGKSRFQRVKTKFIELGYLFADPLKCYTLLRTIDELVIPKLSKDFQLGDCPTAFYIKSIQQHTF